MSSVESNFSLRNHNNYDIFSKKETEKVHYGNRDIMRLKSFDISININNCVKTEE